MTITTEPNAQPWMARAACVDADPREVDFFYETHVPRAVEAARAVCARCPVFDRCAEWAATDDGNLDAILAGQTKDERRGKSTRRYDPAPSACGTERGYHAHRRDKTPACDACRAAHAAHVRGHKRAKAS